LDAECNLGRKSYFVEEACLANEFNRFAPTVNSVRKPHGALLAELAVTLPVPLELPVALTA
jgi:hypothetical protein